MFIQQNVEFVKEVEKYPCLYNYRLLEYSRKDLTESAWTKVGKVFNLTGSQSKEKWKNLRTVLSRNLKPMIDRSMKKRTRPYYLAHAMKFAIPFMKIHTSAGNMPVQHLLENQTETESTCDTENERDIQEFDYEVRVSPGPESSCGVDCSQSPIPSPSISPSPPSYSLPTSPPNVAADSNTRNKKIKDLPEVEKYFLEYLKSKEQSNENTDSIKMSKRMFLLSLLPDLYSMDDAQMRAFRIKVVSLIDEIMKTPNSTQPLCMIAQSSSLASHFYPKSPTQQQQRDTA